MKIESTSYLRNRIELTTNFMNKIILFLKFQGTKLEPLTTL